MTNQTNGPPLIKWFKRMMWHVAIIVISIVAIAIWYEVATKNPWVMRISLAFLGILLGIIVILLIAPLFKEQLTNDPQYPQKGALFTIVEPSRAKLIMRGGNVVNVVRGDRHKETFPPTLADSANVLWWFYKLYVYHFFGMHVIGIPTIQYIHTYKLPRYRMREENGKKIFTPVEPYDAGYRTDHIRNDLTTWYFQFAGAEIGTVSFTIQGSVQIQVNPGREPEALFETDAWNVLLDQALNSVIRGVVRSEVTIDQVIGIVARKIWDDEPDPGRAIYGQVQQKILDALLLYKILGQTLKEVIGLEIVRVDIIDFIPELTPEELASLRAPALKRQIARGRALEGQGEAAYLKEIGEYKDLSGATIWADAMKKSAAAGQMDALAAALLKKMLGA